MLQSPSAPPPPPEAIVPRIVDLGEKQATPSISMIQVALDAFGLTGAIMVCALIAGVLAGALFIWYRRRHPISIIEERGNDHRLFRT